ncbi:MAG: response regulator transcription factor [Oscillospiraceae bacterium]|nr:response regulator transcription factor [Oscillospiraceae bacterium]
MEHILIIEDDSDINNLLCDALTKAGYRCTQAFSGTEGLLRLKQGDFQLIFLDLMLPGANGETVLTEIRKNGSVPVIVMSALDSVDTKIDLLNLGADDYITKPFNVKELVARAAVQLRKASPAVNSSAVSFKDLTLDRSNFLLSVNDVPVELTKHEFKIMELLMLNQDKVFSKQDIYDYAWEDFYIGEDKTVNVHISNIRRKLKQHSETEYIETIWGIGFRMKK